MVATHLLHPIRQNLVTDIVRAERGVGGTGVLVGLSSSRGAQQSFVYAKSLAPGRGCLTDLEFLRDPATAGVRRLPPGVPALYLGVHSYNVVIMCLGDRWRTSRSSGVLLGTSPPHHRAPGGGGDGGLQARWGGSRGVVLQPTSSSSSIRRLAGSIRVAWGRCGTSEVGGLQALMTHPTWRGSSPSSRISRTRTPW